MLLFMIRSFLSVVVERIFNYLFLVSALVTPHPPVRTTSCCEENLIIDDIIVILCFANVPDENFNVQVIYQVLHNKYKF